MFRTAIKAGDTPILKEIILSLNPYSPFILKRCGRYPPPRLSRLLTSEKDPVADWLVAATVLKSADYLPDLTTEVWPLLLRLATVTIDDLARFFQAPTGFTLNTRRSLMQLCGNGLTKPANIVITTIMDHTTSYKLNQNRLSWTVEIFRNGIYFIQFVWVEENHVNVFYVHIGRNSIYKADEYGADEVDHSTQTC